MDAQRRRFMQQATGLTVGFGVAGVTQVRAGADAAGPRKGRALTIGLNRVDPEKYGGWSGRLRGCEPDAKDMKAIAEKGGFDPIVPLLTKDATIQAVQDEIKKAAASLNAGDIFLLTYSGHGGYIPDPTDPPVKPSKMSDTWCLFDGEIIDHELYNAWSACRQGVRILVFSDSCHSGTVVRELLARRSMPRSSFAFQDVPDLRMEFAEIMKMPSLRSAKGDDEPMSSIRGIPIGLQRQVIKDHPEYAARMKAAAKARKENPVKCSVLLLSGCQDNETSSD